MEINQQSPKAYFKMLSMIHIGLVLGVILFGLVDFFYVADFQHPDTQSELANLFVYLVPGLVVVGIVASNMIFVIRMNVLKESTDLKLKMMGYRESLIIRYILLEAPALFALVAIFMTNNINYIVYAVLLVILLIIKRPTRKSAVAYLQLNQHEIAALEDPDSKIV